jgi:hypothetical protein
VFTGQIFPHASAAGWDSLIAFDSPLFAGIAPVSRLRVIAANPALSAEINWCEYDWMFHGLKSGD